MCNLLNSRILLMIRALAVTILLGTALPVACTSPTNSHAGTATRIPISSSTVTAEPRSTTKPCQPPALNVGNGIGKLTVTLVPITATPILPATRVLGSPIEVVSVNGSPTSHSGVDIEVENVSTRTVASLTATLGIRGAASERSFVMEFPSLAQCPLAPGESVRQGQSALGGSFDHETIYSLMVSGTFQDGSTFRENDNVRIAPSSG